MNPFEDWPEEDDVSSHQTQAWRFGEPQPLPHFASARKAVRRYAQYIAVNAARERLGKPPLSSLT